MNAVVVLAPPFLNHRTPRTDRDLHYRACAAGAAEWCEARLSAAPTLVECDQSPPLARKKQKKTFVMKTVEDGRLSCNVATS